MSSEYKKLIQNLEKKSFAPVYLIDGEEPYYLDLITGYFEKKILNESERDFNLMSLYGKDVSWSDVINACRRYPMFAEKQVVILKDAAQMRDINELANYVSQPMPTTIFLIEHRFKRVDGRSKLLKLVKDKGVYFTSDKLKDDAIPQWIQAFGDSIGFRIPQRESEILATYLGNDLQKISNEIEKVRINVPGEKELTGALIQKFIGISREYNVFEMPEALTSRDKDKLYRMLNYFIANPKAAPMPVVVGSFYSHFSRMYQVQFVRGKDNKEAAAALGMNPYFLQKLLAASSKWSLAAIEYCLLVIAKTSAAAVGIDSNLRDGELLKDMIARLELAAPNT